MSMSKKDFIALADAIKNGQGTEWQFSKYQIEEIAYFCQSTNPNFNRDRWISYINGECGKNGGKVK